MSSQVIVLNYGTPHQRLLAWFLADSGIANTQVASAPDAVELARGAPRAIIVVNTAERLDDVAVMLGTLRACVPTPRIIVVHEGSHSPDQPELDADLCIHDVHDVDDLVKLVLAALRGDVPDEDDDPHEAAEEIIDEPLAG